MGRAEGTTVGWVSGSFDTPTGYCRLLSLSPAPGPWALHGLGCIGDTEEVQAFTVASGIVIEDDRLLLVQNQRRNGSLDWTTPGGVVDPGEQVLEALTREVSEETALTVSGWSSMFYAVEAEFARRQITLRAEVYRAEVFSGSLMIDDPDDIVVDGSWVDANEALVLLDTSPRWVAEPLRHAIDALFADGDPSRCAPPITPATWRYRVEEAQITHTQVDATKTKRAAEGPHVVLLNGPEVVQDR